MDDLTVHQKTAAVHETEIAIFLIDEGLRALQREIRIPDRWYVPFVLLAQGYERLLKLVVILNCLDAGGSPVTSKVLRKKYGHGLTRLLADVRALMKKPGYVANRSALLKDLAFLGRSKGLSVLVDALSDFGGGGRYYELESLVGGKPTDDPYRLAVGIELHFRETHPKWRARHGVLNDQDLDAFYDEFLGYLTTMLQHFARALCRPFTFGLLGDLGKLASGPTYRFLTLRDEQLATLPEPES